MKEIENEGVAEVWMGGIIFLYYIHALIYKWKRDLCWLTGKHEGGKRSTWQIIHGLCKVHGLALFLFID